MLLYLSVRKKSKTKKPKKRFHVCGPCFSTSPCLLQKIIAAKIYRSLLGANIKSIQMMAGHQISRLNAGLDIGSKKNQQGCSVVSSHFSLCPWFLSSFLLRVLDKTDLEIPISSAKNQKKIKNHKNKKRACCCIFLSEKHWKQKTNKAAVSYFPIFLGILGSYLHFFFEC